MGTTTRISIASDGTQGNGFSRAPVISGDGRYVAFRSTANNLGEGDTNSVDDIFIRDRLLGTTTRVSVASNGDQANDMSDAPVISQDGRYVAFASYANNLVSGDTNANRDIFLRDRISGTTTRVSVTSSGAEANAWSDLPAISGDGHYIAFVSSASNLVAGDNYGTEDIFVHDRTSGTTTRVSVASDGTPANNGSISPAFSSDGRYIAFESRASNLVPGDTNGTADIFVYDLQTNTTTRVSVASDGTQGDSWSGSPVLSSDGRYIAFESDSGNLVPGDNNGRRDIFVHDRLFGTTTRVSLANDGSQGSDHSRLPSISADGRYVAFLSEANNLVVGDTNYLDDIFVRDRTAGTTTRVSVASDGSEGYGGMGNWYTSISANGRYVAFQSMSANLVPDDTNNTADILLHDYLGDSQVNIINGTDQNDTLDGTDGSDAINGLGGNDKIFGLGDNDTLDGGLGKDTMTGGPGDDTYLVDNSGDRLLENSNQGTDTVLASVSHTLAANLENLTLVGVANLAGIGNTLDNSLIGNSGSNRLNGSSGNDTLTGGEGNDNYSIDSSSDVIKEDSNQGIDIVNVSFDNYTLGSNLENLLLTDNALQGTGNEFNNRLTGNTNNNTLMGLGGNDTLNGGLGDDTMTGGADSDTYFVDSSNDVVTEAENEGIDTVKATSDYSLSPYVDNLTLTGNLNLNGNGNDLNNKLIGNVGANDLKGEEGDDTLLGGAGVDILRGGAGNDLLTGGLDGDKFLFGSDGNSFPDLGADRLKDFLAGIDQLLLHPDTFSTLSSGNLPAEEFATITVKLTQEVAAAGSSSAQIVYNSTTGNLFYNPDGNTSDLGGGGLVATLTNKPALGNTDLLIQNI